jgi:uncharacterized protein YlaI
MDFDEQFELNHLLLNDRRCKVCDEVKNLVEGFYRTRKNRGAVPSSYSYICKECTIKAVIERRRNKSPTYKWEYPDW